MVRWRLRELAQPERWNVQKLSDATGLAYTTVASIWHNKAKRADLETIAKLARVLGVAPGSLLVEDSDTPNDVMA